MNSPCEFGGLFFAWTGYQPDGLVTALVLTVWNYFQGETQLTYRWTQTILGQVYL